MTSNAMAHAATTAVKSAASHTGTELPAQSRSLQTADFERLMAQAQEQQAQVQLTNPVGELGQQNVHHVTKAIGASSQSLQASIDASKAALDQVDIHDMASVMKAGDQFMQTAVRGVEFKMMMDQVTISRKSLGELFHMQG